MNLAERLGYSKDDRVLLLHADDVGSSHAANVASFECLDHGSLTTASILVPAAWFPGVASYARAHSEADFGIHLTLNCEYSAYRWRPVTERSVAPGLYDAEGYLWRTTDESVQHVSAEEGALEQRAQIERALAAGIDVTHLDTHMGTVFQPKFIESFVSLGIEHKIPLFIYRPNPERMKRQGFGALWEGIERQLRRLDETGFPVLDSVVTQTGRTLETKRAYFMEIFERLRPGVTHFLVHPAKLSEETLALGADAPLRNLDYEIFRDRSMAEELDRLGVKTITYREIRDAYRSGKLR
ncbi:MAG: polysaccharide deacetylase family protein [Dehalococcoidia bacterium]